MTIILSCLTPSYIIQVSDRRLSIPRLQPIWAGGFNRKYEPVDENSNKAILWDGRIAISYTGLATIANMPTDRWITKTLAQFSNAQEGIEGLKDEATSYFQKYEPYNPNGLLAIVGIGYSNLKSSLKGAPFLFLISNYHLDLQNIGLRQLQFNLFIGCLSEKHSIALFVAGQPLSRFEYFGLKRYLRTALRKNLKPQVATALLAWKIREVADHNSSVNKNLMVISIPRIEPTAITLPNGIQGNLIPYGQPSQEYISFYYLAEDNKKIEYGPNTVGHKIYTYGYKHEIKGSKEIFSFTPGFTDLDHAK